MLVYFSCRQFRNKIDKEEYTAILKKMFKNLVLPVEMVDKFDFESSPSVW
jgi:hypothetical protein